MCMWFGMKTYAQMSSVNRLRARSSASISHRQGRSRLKNGWRRKHENVNAWAAVASSELRRSLRMRPSGRRMVVSYWSCDAGGWAFAAIEHAHAEYRASMPPVLQHLFPRRTAEQTKSGAAKENREPVATTVPVPRVMLIRSRITGAKPADREPGAPKLPEASRLSASDRELIEIAQSSIRSRYKPDRHAVACALRARGGKVHVGVHLECKLGRVTVCAEAVAIGRAVTDGDGEAIETIVAVRQNSLRDESPGVVSPCGMCREMIADYAPQARIIIPGREGPRVVGLDALLPERYRGTDESSFV